MAVYVVAQLRFRNEARYRRYRERFAEIFALADGRLLAADERPSLLEGDWFGDKVVLMEFEDDRSAMDFLEGPEYQAISSDRRAGAETVALLVRGLP